MLVRLNFAVFCSFKYFPLTSVTCLQKSSK